MTLKKKSFAGAWEGRFATEEYEAVMEQRRDTAITVDWEEKCRCEDVMSGAEIYKIIHESNKSLDVECQWNNFYNEHEGVIPGLLNVGTVKEKNYKHNLKKQKMQITKLK